MAESLRGGLSLCLSGFGFWSHDMGGFEQTASADVYKRWCAFGLLSSHSRLHGSSSYRVPWLFDDEAVDVLRHFTQLKCRLMPYLFEAGLQAHECGTPVMRAMPLEFPADPACDTLDRQYMLGGSLLVAPVFSPDGMVDYYLPAGRWTRLLSNETVEGGRWLREQHAYLSLPLLARPDSIIPFGANDQRPDYDYAAGVVFHVFELADGSTHTVRVPDVKGGIDLILQAGRIGQSLVFNASGEGVKLNWRILLRGVSAVHSLSGAASQPDPLGTLLVPDEGASHLEIVL